MMGDHILFAGGPEGIALFRDCAVWIFADGFETGDLLGWSSTVPDW